VEGQCGLESEVLLGDSGYACTPFLISPNRKALSTIEPINPCPASLNNALGFISFTQK